MTRLKATFIVASIALVSSQIPLTATAQGKGGGKGQGGGHGGGQAQGKSHGAGKSQGKEQEKAHIQPTNQGAGRSGKPSNTPRSVAATKGSSSLGRANGGRRQDVIVASAIAQAHAHGHGNDFRIDKSGNRVRIVNRNGVRLVDLDDESARNLGGWRVSPVSNAVRGGAPSFCRSGAGHPVWGREWCLDKGFGLGTYGDFRWGRADDVGNIYFSPNGYGNSIAGNALVNLLGSTAYNRLALQAISLGLLDPLVGRWVSQPSGPQMLYVNSGSYPVAELVDANRDNRVENILFALSRLL